MSKFLSDGILLRNTEQEFSEEVIELKIPNSITQQVKAIVENENIPLNTVLLSAYTLLLSKYSTEQECTVENIVQNESSYSFVDISNSISQSSFLHSCANITKQLSEIADAYNNSQYHHLVFDSVNQLRNTQSQYGIWLSLKESKNLVFEIGFNSVLFSKKDINTFANHFKNILQLVANNPAIQVNDVCILSKNEQNTVINEFNNTEFVIKCKTISNIFEEQVLKYPNNIAVDYQNKTLTYHELNKKANQLANYLLQKGVNQNDIVAIIAERSLEMVIAMLAVLKVGAAYLPVNPNYPQDRINYMLQDSKSKIALVQDEFCNKATTVAVIDLNDKDIYSTNDSNNLNSLANPNHPAYVIYTSGSTGKPKGVVVQHKALQNFLTTIHHRFNNNVKQGDKCLSLTNISFDVAVCEIFLPLCYGATLILFENNLVIDINNLVNTIEDKKITFAYIPPTILKEVYDLLINKKIDLNKMLVGVESIKDYILEDYLKLNPKMQIINGYGPTEATICATMFNYQSQHPSGKNVSIGTPLLNTKIYVLDKDQNPVPIGVAGELCIAGNNLAKGYLHKPEMTAQRFVNNPFSTGKMYKTGDLARWHDNGTIEFLGRIDYQVKIRGFRVEPGEIENQLLKLACIKQAVVIAKQNNQGVKYLCAYYVADKHISVSELRNNLLLKLPSYMIPSYFSQLKKLPLTLNGKIDRKALPEPTEQINTGIEYVAPRTEIEQVLTDIFKQNLAVSRIGINDDFFILGGDSLKAIKLVTLVQKQLKVDLSVSDIFNNSTINKLAGFIKKANLGEYVAIKRVKEQELYDVSSAQKRIYAVSQVANNTNYNLPVVKILKGEVDIVHLQNCLKQLISRHEAFRTSFVLHNNEIKQRIHSSVELKIDYKELKSNLHDYLTNEIISFVKPFNLAQAPLLRVKIIKSANQQYALLIDMHHIISDGTSMGIFMEELSSLYNGESLIQKQVHYKDYSAYEKQIMYSEDIKTHEQYWLDMYSDEVPILNLPTDYKRPKVQSFEGDNISFTINEELSKKIKSFCLNNGVTLYMTLLAAYNVLLAKYSGQEDIIVGAAAAGRQHADLQNMMGMFINTLALRNKPHGYKEFKNFLQEVKQNSLNAYENQSYQFDMLVDKLAIPRDQSRGALVDTVFVLQNTNTKQLRLNKALVSDYTFKDKVSKFDLTLEAYEQQNELIFNFEYCTKLFKPESIYRLIEHFKTILVSVTSEPSIKISQIDMLTSAEQQNLLYGFNNTSTEYPHQSSICDLFEEQVKLTPNKIAVVHNNNKLTYLELNSKANALAHTLTEQGVQQSDIVGLMTERSLAMVIGTLAILKVGAAYLPIDADYPTDRIKYMLKDSKAKLLLTEQKFVNEVEFYGSIINLNDNASYSQNQSNPLFEASPYSLAYIIYTSGTTGKPKGVAVKQQNVVRLVKNTNYIEFNQDDKILQTGSITFDASTFEIWGALLNGLSLYLTSKDVILSAEKLGRCLAENKITILWLTSPLFNKLCEEKPTIFTGLRYLLVGGDVVSPKNVEIVKKQAPQLTVVNGYGPTENTTFSTCYVIKEDFDSSKPIPIGKPIANSTAYIFNQYNQLVPIGVYGELCVGGDGLASGYLNSPELTNEKFVSNPYLKNQLMYRTGDLVRWLPNGNIEFAGRIDFQVKIRGFRIEPAEIENSLLKISGIKEAIIIVREKNKSKYLTAYYVSDTSYSSSQIRTELKQLLPDYMIPAYFTQLTEMPLNQNGKINRKLLPIPSGDIETGIEYLAASTEVEEKLVKIWSEILEVNKIGVKDDFFTLGGHSLKAIKIAALIEKELATEITVSDIFNHPTIRQLAKQLSTSNKVNHTAIKPVAKQEYYAVSSAQKRMYALNQFSVNNTNYNIPIVKLLTGKLNISQVEQSFNHLIKRHEAFRTSFELINNEIMQRVNQNVQFKLDYIKQSLTTPELINNAINSFVKPFDLSQAPLLRVKLIEIAKDKHLLMFDMHHIISDGTSMDILMLEFTDLYNGEKLHELNIQYKDYSAWEHEELKSPTMLKHEQYWLDMYSNEIPVLNLPTDYTRPNVPSFKGSSLSFSVSEELSQKLNELAKQHNASLYMVLLAAYNVFLAKYSGQEDIVVGSPIAGRQHADLNEMLGMFVNTLTMRNYPDGNKSFNQLIQEVKQNALSAYEHQDYPFDRLVEKLEINRELSRNPLFDTMFILQNTANTDIQLNNITIKNYRFERGMSKFDMTLEAKEVNNYIEFNLEYSTSLFAKATIKRLIDHFKNILNTIAFNPQQTIAEIEMLTKSERQQILSDFNNTATEYNQQKTICELFEEQVDKVPNNLAVVFEGKSLSYKQLNEKANQVAYTLRNKGVKPDSVVGILVDRSLEMMIGVMAILKSGAAYMPISPEYPEDRVNYMLNDSKAEVLLTQNHLLNTVSFEGHLIDLNDENIYNTRSENLSLVNSNKDLAYVIYTSGSTGKPKGVMIEHGNVNNLVTALHKNIYSKYSDYLNITLISPYVFDASVKQIFACLLKGHCLHIIPEEYRYMGSKLVEYYIENNIDISDGTPSHFKLILGDDTTNIKDIPVKHFIIGGEELPVNVVKEFLAFFVKKPKITNIYGPTECCVDTTAYLVNNEQLNSISSIPIGHPLANYRVYVVNKAHKLLPVGVAGELCIAGHGLARGYLNRPALTNQKFVNDPFVTGEKMYKTGDLVKWLPSGDIEFLGRIDFQVKIRGYRIEIGEIDSLIKGFNTVKDSVVLAKADSSGEKRLVAYVVPKTEQYSEAELKSYLKNKLPKYMIPAVFVKLDTMPLNSNGKVDRFALPEPDMQQRGSDEDYIAPRNQAEIAMATKWSEILGIDKIGIDEDFFDLGGDSFKAIKLVRGVSENLGVMDLFKNSTIRELVAYLAKGDTGERGMLIELTKPIADKDRAVSIICFPFGGGSAISYQPLANALPKNYSLYAVELPGHDFSRPDEDLASIQESAERCLAEIKQKIKGPIVLYGHCLGATMAAYLAYELEKANMQVDGVFMGAMFPAPRITNKFFKIWDKIFPSLLTDKGNKDLLRTIGGLTSDISAEESDFIIRNLRHDSKECIDWYSEVYSEKDNPKFNAPITCVIGDGDRMTEFYQERYHEWEYFSDYVDLRTVENGGHFFFKSQADELAEIIEEKISFWQSSEFLAQKEAAANDENVVDIKTRKKPIRPSMQLFLTVAIVQIFSEVGSIIAMVGASLWIIQQTGTLSDFAVMMLFRIIPTIVIMPFSGAIVDRFNKRLILIVGDLIAAFGSAILILMLFNNGLEIWHIYIFTVLSSIATCFRQPAYLAAVTQITPKMYLAQANSVAQFSVAIGNIIGPLFAGILMVTIGFKGLVLIDFVSFFVAIGVLASIRFPNTMFTRSEEPILKELLGGWNFIVKRKSMVSMVLFFLVVNFVFGLFDVIMMPLIGSFATESVVGVVRSFMGFGILAGSIIMLATGGLRKRAKGMVGFVIPLAISVCIAGFRPSPIFAALAYFGVHFSIAVVDVHWRSLIQVKVGLELQGRVFAVNRMLVSMLAPLSYLTASLVTTKLMPVLQSDFFNTPLANFIIGQGEGRGMRLSLIIAGLGLLVWAVLGLRYKPLSNMDDILADASQGEIVIKDKDKLQELIDKKQNKIVG